MLPFLPAHNKMQLAHVHCISTIIVIFIVVLVNFSLLVCLLWGVWSQREVSCLEWMPILGQRGRAMLPN